MTRNAHSGLSAGLATLLAILAAPATAGSGGAALELPGTSPVADVAQTQFRDGFAQRISFQGGQRGVAEVSIRTGIGRSDSGPALTMAKPSRTGIAAELRTRFPAESMRVVTQARRNAYGPVGMALGSDCLYAWQWIDLSTGRAGARSRPNTLFGERAESAASVRIKLCRTGTATLADLASSVERMTLSTSPEDRRTPPTAVPHPARRAAASRRDTPLARPQGAGPVATDAGAAGVRAPGQMDRPGADAPRAEPTRRALSDREADGQRYIVRPAGAGVGQMPPIVPVPAPADPSQVPRYITDTESRPNNTAIAVPKPVPNRAEVEDTLARELPTRAYRPPP